MHQDIVVQKQTIVILISAVTLYAGMVRVIVKVRSSARILSSAAITIAQMVQITIAALQGEFKLDKFSTIQSA